MVGRAGRPPQTDSDYPRRAASRAGRLPHPRSSPCPTGSICPPPPLPGGRGRVSIFTTTRFIRVSLASQMRARSGEADPHLRGSGGREGTRSSGGPAWRPGLGSDRSHYPSPAARPRAGGAREGRRCGGTGCAGRSRLSESISQRLRVGHETTRIIRVTGPGAGMRARPACGLCRVCVRARARLRARLRACVCSCRGSRTRGLAEGGG